MANYTIKAGDTLFEIAKSHNITLAALQAANPGLNPTTLHVGQVIHLPGGGSSGPHPHHQQAASPARAAAPTAAAATSNMADRPPTSHTLHLGQLRRPLDPKLTPHEIPRLRPRDRLHQVRHRTRRDRIPRRRPRHPVHHRARIRGNVRIQTTNNGVRNPGLMQSHNGVEFNPANPAGSILQMVRDGTTGTKDGAGLKQLHDKYGNYYSAFRGYNSGSVHEGDLNDPVGSTGSYVRDAANRLMGHVWANM